MQIVMLAAMSHSPGWDMRFDRAGPGERFVAAVDATRRRMAEARPEVLVVFGPDHFRNFFYDVMPPFCIGVEAVEAFGDFGTVKGALPGDPPLGRFIADRVAAEDFDPAISFHMGVDHGVTQAYQALAGGSSPRVVPIMINCAGAGMASLRRCHALGRAVGRALRAFPGDGRAAVIGSGGLSHWPPSSSPYDETLSAQQRDYLITGRPEAAASSAARDGIALKLRAGDITGRVNPAWDAWFLDRIGEGDIEALLALDDEDLLRDAGTGGHEVRCWIAALGAWGGAIDTLAYESVPSWLTGMGCVSGAAADAPAAA